MPKTIFIGTLFIIFTVFINIFFVPGLTNPWSEINVIMLALIFILAFSSLEKALWFSGISGLLTDLFTYNLYGFNTITLTLITIFAYYLFKNILTNHSLYSFLVLMVFFYFFRLVLIYFLIYFLTFWNNAISFPAIDYNNIFLGLSVNLLIVAILFYIVTTINKNLMPLFLKR